MTYKGCFSSFEPLEEPARNSSFQQFQTAGLCQQICGGEGRPVFGLVSGSDCLCGDLLPAADTVVDDGECNTPCHGYDKHTCGGNGHYQVYLSGVNRNEIDHFEPSSSSTSSKTASVGESTVILTRPVTTSAAPEDEPESSSGANTAAIAGGAVAGILATIAIVAGVFVFLRRRKQHAAEEAYKRGAAVSSFIENGKRPPMYANDNRLDPTAANRRMSDGSIADNEDYSRRILKVTNPDDS